MNEDDRNSLASTDRGCPLCQNTRPCSYLKPELLEPPDDTLFHDDDEASSSSSSSFSQHHNGTCGEHPPCSSSHHNHHHDNCNSNHNHNNHHHNNNHNTTNYKNNNSDNNNPRFRTHHNQQWQAMFEQLRQFQQAHGHCNVPSRSSDHPALAGWVKRQRHQYARLSNSTINSTLTPDRIAALNALGLVWNVRDATWMERYAELVQFRQQHGHVRVPSHHPANQVLAAWVKAQRHSMHVQPQAMPAWRKAKLDALGFEWRILSTGKSKQEESSAVVPMEMDE